MVSRWKFFAVVLLMLLVAAPLAAQAPAFPLPRVTFGVDQAQGPGEVAVALQILLLLTILSVAPAIIIMVTSFVRIAIVFSFTRMALATQQMPPNQVLMGLALFLTIFIMAPTIQTVNEEALQPLLANQIDADEFYERGIEPVREFMFRQTRENDIALFLHLGRVERPRSRDDVPTYVLIPAFMVSEITTAFKIGILIFIPFIIIDMVVASTLMSMGMIMLPPVMVSLPFKIILFFLVDGWNLLVQNLVEGFL